jgi:hypothetical protein
VATCGQAKDASRRRETDDIEMILRMRGQLRRGSNVSIRMMDFVCIVNFENFTLQPIAGFASRSAQLFKKEPAWLECDDVMSK